jgi:hypothetical protein
MSPRLAPSDGAAVLSWAPPATFHPMRKWRPAERLQSAEIDADPVPKLSIAYRSMRSSPANSGARARRSLMFLSGRNRVPICRSAPSRSGPAQIPNS